MRCLSILILAGVFCTVSAKVYSLGEIVGITVKNSRSIRIIEQEMYKSEAEVQAVYGQSFPHVSLQMNLSHNFSKVDYGFAPTGNEFIDNLFKSISSTIEPKQSSGQIGLTLDQPLFAQGKVYYGLKLAKKNKREEKYEYGNNQTLENQYELNCIISNENNRSGIIQFLWQLFAVLSLALKPKHENREQGRREEFLLASLLGIPHVDVL